MDDDAYDDEEYEEEGPSLAYPPLYLLRSADRCPECGRGQHVFQLACTGLGDALYGGGASGEVHFLRRIENLPEPLLALLQAKLPRFTLDATFEDERPYLMNHCPCGAKLDDYFVAGDVGAAFWPDTPDGYRQLKLLRLPVEEPVELVASFSVGGGEYLDFANTWEW